MYHIEALNLTIHGHYTYVCNVPAIFAQGMCQCEMYVYQHLWWHCWVHWVHMRYIYWHSCLICVHELTGKCGIYIWKLMGHICCWYIYGYSMKNKSCSFFFTFCAVMWSLHFNHIDPRNIVDLVPMLLAPNAANTCANGVSDQKSHVAPHYDHCWQ